jgi:hypothetical protein
MFVSDDYLAVLHYMFGLLVSENTKGGSITVPLNYCLTGLESAVW